MGSLCNWLIVLCYIIFFKNVFWALAFTGTTIFNFYKVQYMGPFLSAAVVAAAVAVGCLS